MWTYTPIPRYTQYPCITSDLANFGPTAANKLLIRWSLGQGLGGQWVGLILAPIVGACANTYIKAVRLKNEAVVEIKGDLPSVVWALGFPQPPVGFAVCAVASSFFVT